MTLANNLSFQSLDYSRLMGSIDQLQGLDEHFKSIGEHIASAFSELAEQPVTARIIESKQHMSAEQFNELSESLGTINYQAIGWKNEISLFYPNDLWQTFVCCLFGGSGQGNFGDISRPISSTENALLSRLKTEILVRIQGELQNIEPTALVIKTDDSYDNDEIQNPDGYLMTVFSLSIFDQQFLIRFALPHTIVSRNWSTLRRSGQLSVHNSPSINSFADQVSATHIELTTVIEKSDTKLGELVDLHPGQYFDLELPRSVPVNIEANQVRVFSGCLQENHGRYQVRIEEMMIPKSLACEQSQLINSKKEVG